MIQKRWEQIARYRASDPNLKFCLLEIKYDGV